MDKCLSPEQQKLVEENHNLIYSFMIKYHLNQDEFYDVLAIALCNAAINFDPQKGEFSSIAYKYMRNEMMNYFRYINAPKRYKDEECLSYNVHNPLVDDESLTYLDTIATDDFFEKNAIIRCSIQKVWVKLNSKEKQIVRLLYDGYSRKDICEMLHFSGTAYTNWIHKIRGKLINYIQ